MSRTLALWIAGLAIAAVAPIAACAVERSPSTAERAAHQRDDYRPNEAVAEIGGCSITCEDTDPGPCEICDPSDSAFGGNAYGGGTSTCQIACNGGVGDNAKCECIEGKARCSCNW